MKQTKLDEFKNRLNEQWLRPFCAAKNYSAEGFVLESVDQLHESDVADFIYAIDRQLVSQHGWFFRAKQSKAKEQIFWEGRRSVEPRKITLWYEPIITIAALARLVRDFSWPSEQLGMQSEDWAFDLVAYHQSQPVLVCEVKKSQKEVDGLVALMDRHRATPVEKGREFEGTERNAFKKICALRESSSTVLWALGPNGYQRIFKVERAGELRLLASDISALRNASA